MEDIKKKEKNEQKQWHIFVGIAVGLLIGGIMMAIFASSSPQAIKSSVGFSEMTAIDWKLTTDGNFNGNFRNDMNSSINITGCNIVNGNTSCTCFIPKSIIPAGGKFQINAKNCASPNIRVRDEYKIDVDIDYDRDGYTTTRAMGIMRGVYK